MLRCAAAIPASLSAMLLFIAVHHSASLCLAVLLICYAMLICSAALHRSAPVVVCIALFRSSPLTVLYRPASLLCSDSPVLLCIALERYPLCCFVLRCCYVSSSSVLVLLYSSSVQRACALLFCIALHLPALVVLFVAPLRLSDLVYSSSLCLALYCLLVYALIFCSAAPHRPASPGTCCSQHRPASLSCFFVFFIALHLSLSFSHLRYSALPLCIAPH
jgi:hypothetical protein